MDAPEKIRGARRWALVAAVLVLVAWTAPEASAAEPELTVSSVTVSRAAVTVSGVNTVRVEVQVTANVPLAAGPNAAPELAVILTLQGPGGPLRALVASRLMRTSGTGADGVWTGPLWVPSTANGTYQVSEVCLWSFLEDCHGTEVPAPPASPALQVTGVHQPVISATTAPNPVPQGSAYSVVGRVVDGATRQPYASTVAVTIGVDNACAELGAFFNTRTNTSGYYSQRLPADAFGQINCAIIFSNGVRVTSIGFVARGPGELVAAPAAAAARAGSTVLVEGRARRAALCPVVLQRLRGATQWRGVTLARVRASGRLTLPATLGARGAYTYRVHLPACSFATDATTARFAIRAT